MQLADLATETMLVGETNDYTQLAKYLFEVLNGESRYFTHMEPIHGADRSGRILYQGPCGKAARLPSLATPLHAAAEFEKLVPEARYEPLGHPPQRKGWEVSYAIIDGRRAAIVWAKWVEPE